MVGDAWRKQTRIVCNKVGIPVLTGGMSLNRVVLGVKCCKNSPNVSCVAVSVCSDLGTSGGGVAVMDPCSWWKTFLPLAPFTTSLL